MDYMVKNYALIVMIVGMLILTSFDVFLEKKMLIRLRITLVMLFALSLFDYWEVYFSHLEASESVVWMRTLLSALCYSLRPMIVMMLVFLIHRKAHWMITIPAMLNVIASFSAFFTGIVYYIKPTNGFSRGPLGYTPHIVSIIYIVGLFFLSFKVLARRSFEEGAIIMFFAVTGAFAALISTLDKDVDTNLLYGAEILLYYLYVYGQYTKRDALTGLLNRQSFYSDIERYGAAVTGIVSIDMNELKWMNDTLGHSTGDKALETVSECFIRPASVKDKIYRIGGDEFVAICLRQTEEEMRKFVEDMRGEV